MSRLVDIENLRDIFREDEVYNSELYDYGCWSHTAVLDSELLVICAAIVHDKNEVRYINFHINYSSKEISTDLQHIIDWITKKNQPCMAFVSEADIEKKIKTYLSTMYNNKIHVGNRNYIVITEDLYFIDYTINKH